MRGLDSDSILDRICDTAFQSVIKHMLEGYIVVGGSAEVQAFVDRRGYGLDLVWDLWNEQFSAFTYPLIATAWPTFGAGLTAYAGFGFGQHDNVHEAWSGEFSVAEAAIEVGVWRIVELEGQITYFASPGNATVGGAVGGTAAVRVPKLGELFRLPLGASASHAVDHWTPCDPVTRRLFNPRVANSRVIKLPAVSGGHGGRRGATSHAASTGAVRPHRAAGHARASSHGSSGSHGTHASRSGGHGSGHGGGHAPKPHFAVDLSPGLWGVGQHIASVLGETNPLAGGFAMYAGAVSLIKEFMRANGMLAQGRAAGLEKIHAWMCNEPYRLILRYEQEVPTGTEQREFDDNRYTVQRTPNGNYLMTSAVGRDAATGSWSSIMRLHRPDGSVHPAVSGVRFRMVGTGRLGSPDGYIGGKRYSATAFSNELMRIRQRMMAA